MFITAKQEREQTTENTKCYFKAEAFAMVNDRVRGTFKLVRENQIAKRFSKNIDIGISIDSETISTIKLSEIATIRNKSSHRSAHVSAGCLYT